MAESLDESIFSEETLPKSAVPTYNWVEITESFLDGCKGLYFLKRICNVTLKKNMIELILSL